MDYLKEFISKLQNLDKSKNIAIIFKDFLTLSTCSLAQPFYRSPNIEQKYKNTICNYSKEQAEEFSKLLALLISALEEKHQDFLGKVFSDLNLGKSNKGQFFTPYHVSKMMSEINISVSGQQFEEKGFITLLEPCSGSGGMIIAYAEILKEEGYNYQHQLYVEAIDIDEICFMMTYIQLSLYGIPAKVLLGDSLALKFQKSLYTPLYFINGFSYKLKAKDNIPKPDIPKEIIPTQLSLFKEVLV